MGERTQIQWVDSSVNPTNGCDGCELIDGICYAEDITELWGGGGLRGPAIGVNGIKLTPEQARNFTALSMAPGRMAEAAKWRDLTGTPRLHHKGKPRSPWLDGLPRLTFVSDMSDALSAGFSFQYLREEIIDTVRSAKGLRHCWLWLTKRPGRMAEFAEWLKADGIDWPVNLWIGTSLTTQQSLPRAKALLEVADEKTIRFLSVEPQWESIDLGSLLPRLDWIIQGGESRRRRREGKPEPPEPHDFDGMWADDLRDKCKAANVPYFLKQFGAKPTFQGKPYSFKDPHGGDWSEWPERFRVREFPQPAGFGRTVRWAETPLAGSVWDGCEPWNGQSFLTDAEKVQLTKSHAAQGKRPEAKSPSVLVHPKDNGKDPKMVAAGKKAWETRRRRQDALNAAVEVAAEAKARAAVKSVPPAAPVTAKRATLGNIYRPWISANGKKIFASSYGLAAFCIPVNVGDLKP